MIFTSVQQAENWMKGKIQSFYDQSRVLRDRLVQIGQLENKAKEQNDQKALGQLAALKTQTKQLFTEQLSLEQKLMPFAQYFNVNTGLGAFPPFLAVAAIGMAGLMYLHFDKLQNQGKALELVAEGFMSPSEAAKILSGGGLFDLGGGLFSPVIILGVGFLIFYLRKGVAYKGVG